MKRVVGLVVAVVVVLGIAGFAWLHAADASGQPAKVKVAANVKVAISAKDVLDDGRRAKAEL